MKFRVEIFETVEVELEAKNGLAEPTDDEIMESAIQKCEKSNWPSATIVELP